MADSMDEHGELVVGSSEEVKLPRQRSVFPKPTRNTAICRASYTSTPTARPPTPIATSSSSTTSRRTRSPATSKVGRTDREARERGRRRRRSPRIQVTWTRTLTPSTPPREMAKERTPSRRRRNFPHFPWHPHYSGPENLSEDTDGYPYSGSLVRQVVKDSNHLG